MVSEAVDFFQGQKKILKQLEKITKLGLGYISLGQDTSSFSGGEAQRLKLLSLLSNVKKQKPSLLILDEPSSGLSNYDVQALLLQLDELTQHGHTVVLVEHHLNVLSACDWLIEIGPEAGVDGGYKVVEGPPKEIKKAKQSQTKKYLFKR